MFVFYFWDSFKLIFTIFHNMNKMFSVLESSYNKIRKLTSKNIKF
jgi:chloramphenicol O-acetyltransferase